VFFNHEQDAVVEQERNLREREIELMAANRAASLKEEQALQEVAKLEKV